MADEPKQEVTELMVCELYLLTRMQKHIEEVTDAKKTAVKGILGAEQKVDLGGLKLTTTKTQARYSFNPEKAAARLGKTKYATEELLISAKVDPATIPDSVLVTLGEYFNIEKRAVVSEGNAALAVQNGDCEKDEVYDKGKEFFNLLTPAKLSNQELVARYKAITNTDPSTLLLSGPE
jgi:hypothetical protein